jgi:hypothetical protein
MNSVLCRAAPALLAGACLLSAPGAVAGEAGMNVGMLKCDVKAGMSFVFGSTRDVVCVFSPAGDRSPENYLGTIKKFGVDIGYVDAGVMLWAVLAPTKDVKAGALAGTYAGATASAAAGPGVGANALIGGENSVTLQPLSITGMTGVNVAAGLGVLDLKASD